MAKVFALIGVAGVVLIAKAPTQGLAVGVAVASAVGVVFLGTVFFDMMKRKGLTGVQFLFALPVAVSIYTASYIGAPLALAALAILIDWLMGERSKIRTS